MGTHFFHYTATVHLDGLFRNPEIEGHLLVQHTGDQKPEHLAFPWGEGIPLRAELFHFLLLMPQATGLFNPPGNRVQEVLVLEGFLEEIHSAGFKGPHALRDRPVAGDENDGKRNALIGQPVLEFQIAQPWHLDVKNEATRRIGVGEIQKFKGRREGLSLMAGRSQQTSRAFRTDGSSSTTYTTGFSSVTTNLPGVPAT